MRLHHVEMSGFRGYSEPVRIEFAHSFTIIDGRNGVGKSSIFDAIEFALLGTLTKYEGATADRESAKDYIWWRGDGPVAEERYVEVGFVDGEAIKIIRRSMLTDPGAAELAAIREALLLPDVAPSESLGQLLRNSIIRDEHIAALSLDLRETERYQVLCDAIGALGSDEWIDKASRLLSEAQRRSKSAEFEAQAALVAVNNAGSRLAQIDAAAVPPEQIREAERALIEIVGAKLNQAELIGAAQARVVELREQAQGQRIMAPQLSQADDDRKELQRLTAAIESMEAQIAETVTGLETSAARLAEQPQGLGEELIDELAQIIAIGQHVGLQNHSCPLCSTELTEASFQKGVQSSEARLGLAREAALRRAEYVREHNQITGQLSAARRQLEDLRVARATVTSRLETLAAVLNELELGDQASVDALNANAARLEENANNIARHIATMLTLRLAPTREAAAETQTEAKNRQVRSEERLGVARRAEERAKAIYDAARRAAGDTLDARLNQILPLTSELYQRLRPHPIWDDIAYKLRGDVKRFLKLEVGDEVNPQFVFSSGQRRATGLAFLLSVYLSLSWSKLDALMLDDPVQHIDDFRSVHLAEVLAQVVATGRQVICSAEDSALADLLARRLPVETLGDGKRITLGVDEGGRLAVIGERAVPPLPKGSFLPLEFKSAS